MAITDLVFGSQPSTNGNLVFGETTVAPVGETEITLSAILPQLSLSAIVAAQASLSLAATLPGLSLSAVVSAGPPIEITATLPGLTLAATAAYDSRTSRPTVAQTQAKQTAADKLPPTGASIKQQDGLPHLASVTDKITAASPLTATLRSAVDDAQHNIQQPVAVCLTDASALSSRLSSKAQDADKLRRAVSSRTQQAQHLNRASSASTQDGLRHARSLITGRTTAALPIFKQHKDIAKLGAPINLALGSKWQNAMRPQPGVREPIIPPGEVCYTPSPHLVFKTLADGLSSLLFICDQAQPDPDTPPVPATIIIPTRRFYMQINTVTLARADTGQEIKATNLSLSIDADSWSWGWAASVPAGYLTMLTADAGDVIEVIAVVNGAEFRLTVESIQRDRSFGKSSLRISGRSRAAWLASPLANSQSRRNVISQTAQQLMADALTENGVSIGWALDWQITDWVVPAGAWSHTGSAIDACNAIAGSVGAYIQAHRKDQILHVMPRYKNAPWEWPAATPDIEIPEAISIAEGIEYINRPDYNRAFVSGTEQGILGQITRTGSAGNIIAPMVTDPLITHADAARQRGIAILGDTGRQKHITLSMPVLTDTGIIQPGKLVRYVEQGQSHLGITRAVSVAVDFPKARQTIRIESHVL